MNKDELWDSVKKGTKPSVDRFDKLDKTIHFLSRRNGDP